MLKYVVLHLPAWFMGLTSMATGEPTIFFGLDAEIQLRNFACCYSDPYCFNVCKYNMIEVRWLRGLRGRDTAPEVWVAWRV
jgi:hypothetical protein